ncbi:pilus assembly protein [Aquamicrobium sp. NLF2-7]|uniref:TadE/TadG family type IV pilus assembly protein n=1 Tax=Aquamicrobium sp. NLF2-7 TaxID=2918753 RepID=UPI001EFAB7C1|nr:TadE/TadG family type IV pilus assembly protein [Aquamicrobium sp. NLF2-7]MCG8272961.1 pilus assembly protein [Aquamicrobium sp. NLF2-7]
MESVPNRSRTKARRRLTSLPGRFRRDAKGSTAIEFGMLILPFALLTFAILESCISFAGKQMLANAADDVARQFRTGQWQAPATAAEKTALQEKIFTLVCGRMSVIVTENCPGLKIDLRHFDNFTDAAKLGYAIEGKQLVLTDNGKTDAKGFVIDPGSTMSRNMLRLFYEWPIITDYMSKYMAPLADNKTVHFATMTWQNEPY